jgi:hypothetical protein
MIDFNNTGSIRDYGFVGFYRIQNLQGNANLIPKIRGIYFVISDHSIEPEFLSIGTGGHFKGRNPNVEIIRLRENWVQDTKVLYIGKAGGGESSATLQSRVRQYLGFGNGKPVGHWGGRFIWQIKNSDDLIFCWKPLPEEDPRAVEKILIQDFYSHYGKLPYANLTY